MAKRNSAKRARSRKRRPAQGEAAEGAQDAAQSSPAANADPADAERAKRGAAAAKPRARESQRTRERARAQAADERPQAPWHPWPLSELLILVGAIGAGIGVKRLNHGVSNASPLLIAGVIAVAIGTLEVTLREHLSGFRAHTVLLALIPTIILHTLVLLVLSAFFVVPRWVNLPVLVLDGALFVFLYKVLRERFIDARRTRLYAARS